MKREELEEELGKKVVTLDDPQITAALGAAISALERSKKNQA